DRGAVILPGLDRGRDAAEWRAIERDETHPQHLMALLLSSLEVAPAEIPDWPPTLTHPAQRAGSPISRDAGEGFEPRVADLPLFARIRSAEDPLSRIAGEGAERSEAGEGARARRVRLIAEALRPAATTDAWRRLPPQAADA